MSVIYEPKFLKQNDPRWASHTAPGKSFRLDDYGCANCCVVNAVLALPKLNHLDADVVSCFDWAVENGYTMVGGTSDSGVGKILEHYGLTDYEFTGRHGANMHDKCKAALAKGDWVIALVGGSVWTRNGHFILVYGLKDGKVLVSDPAHNSDTCQKDQTIGYLTDCAVAYWIINNVRLQGATSNGNRIPISIDYSKLTPYVVTLDRNSYGYDLNELKKNGVVGALIEANSWVNNYGRLDRNVDYRLQEFRQPRFSQEIKDVKASGLPYGYYVNIYARTTSAADLDMNQLYYMIASNNPALGIWISPHFSIDTTKAQNDKIIERYYKRLVDMGFKGKVGFYTTKKQLNYISWDKFQNTWLLWIIDHISDIDELNQLLTPEFFDMDGEG